MPNKDAKFHSDILNGDFDCLYERINFLLLLAECLNLLEFIISLNDIIDIENSRRFSELLYKISVCHFANIQRDPLPKFPPRDNDYLTLHFDSLCRRCVQKAGKGSAACSRGKMMKDKCHLHIPMHDC